VPASVECDERRGAAEEEVDEEPGVAEESEVTDEFVVDQG